MSKAKVCGANLEKLAFEAGPALTCHLLVDSKRVDGKGHTSYLVITKNERKELLARLVSGFGNKLQNKAQDYEVASAQIMRDFLKEDWKSSDEVMIGAAAWAATGADQRTCAIVSALSS